jgi:hypothetical protein
MSDSVIHRGMVWGHTLCGIWVPNLPPGDRYFPEDPTDARACPVHGAKELDPRTNRYVCRTCVEAVVTCPYCLQGEQAPAASDQPPTLAIYTVYEKPRDFPEEYVVRVFTVQGGNLQPGAIVARAPTLEAVQTPFVERGLHRIPRAAGDDPRIVESWI